MASYTAPSENLPIFDPTVFINDLTPITIAEGDKRYLRFPFAQGAEYLTDIFVGGTSTFSGPVAFNDPTLPTSAGTIPVSTDSSTKIPTTAWVQTAITGAIPTSLLGLNNTWTGTQNWTNTTEGSLTSSATQPLTTDNSTKIPTTSWVQSVVSALPLPSSLLALNNTWTGTQNWTSATEGSLTSSATQPLTTDNSTKIPTTSWVQSLVATLPLPSSLLGLNNSWTGTNDFLNTGTGSLTSLATQPVPADSSTKIPTTAWVQSLVATLPLPSSLLGLNNTWTGTQNWTSATEGSLTSSATQPLATDSSTKIPTTAWVQSAISSVGSLLGLNNTWTGTQNWTNTTLGALTSSATQPSYTDSSTKIPTTAWVQGLIGQFLDPITTSRSTAGQIYPPTALHLYATGYIIGTGGLAGAPATPDFGPWGMGGAGGGAGGVSFTFQLQNNVQYVYFGLNYTSAGYSSLSVNSTSPSGANTMAIANKGGNGADAAAGAGGGTGGTGTFTTLSVSGLVSSSGSVNNGTAGTAGTGGQTGSTLVFPTGGSNSLNVSYGFGQSHTALDGYNTSGYINYPASPIGDPRCVIIWSVSP